MAELNDLQTNAFCRRMIVVDGPHLMLRHGEVTDKHKERLQVLKRHPRLLRATA